MNNRTNHRLFSAEADHLDERPDEDPPFRVVTIDGATLGQFPRLLDALDEFNENEAAFAISLGTRIVTQRREANTPARLAPRQPE